MKRFIYAFDSLESARETIAVLNGMGISDEKISLVGRSDLQMEHIPDRYLQAPTDFVPALGRGVAIGGATGVVAGLIAMAIPPLGIAVAGATLIGFFTGGALVGAWSAALVGASIPDEVRRTFEAEIEKGHILLVIDSDQEHDSAITRALSIEADRHLLWQSEIESTATL